MKARITVGPVKVVTEGLDLTSREVRGLMKYAASIALAVIEKASGPEEEPPSTPVGFTAVLERAEPVAPESFFTDDE